MNTLINSKTQYYSLFMPSCKFNILNKEANIYRNIFPNSLCKKDYKSKKNSVGICYCAKALYVNDAGPAVYGRDRFVSPSC